VRQQIADQRGGADAIFDDKGRRIGGAVLLAVVTTQAGAQGRSYRLATERDYAAAYLAGNTVLKLPPGAIPDEPLPPIGTLGFRIQRYGMLRWGDMNNTGGRESAQILSTLPG
jgi:hypothetical protein